MPIAIWGLRQGLVQKWQAAATPQAKWEFMRAFLLDPQNMSDISIESEYIDQSQHDDTHQWVELPLETLKKQYTSPAEKAFLENQVVGKQKGRDHPQDPTNANMRLYWVFKENTDTEKHRAGISTRLKASGLVPANKAARTAVADGLLNAAAKFGKGSSGGKSGEDKGNPKGGEKTKTRKGGGKGKDKNPKVG